MVFIASVALSLATETAMRVMLLDFKINGEFAMRLLRKMLRGAQGAPCVVLTASRSMPALRDVSDGARWWPAG